MPSQYAIQHEFDSEPTYVVHDSNTQLKDQDCVAFGSNLPVDSRGKVGAILALRAAARRKVIRLLGTREGLWSTEGTRKISGVW